VADRGLIPTASRSIMDGVRQRRIVIAAGAGALAVAAAFAWSARGPVLEAWHLRGLGSPSQEVRLGAAEALGRLRSRKAITALVEMARRGEDETRAAAEALARVRGKVYAP